MKIFPIIKKITTVVSGSANAQPLIRIGISVSTVLSWTFDKLRTGVSVVIAPIRLVTLERVGSVVTTRAEGDSLSSVVRQGTRVITINSGSNSKPVVTTGESVTPRSEGTLKPLARSGTRLSTVNSGVATVLPREGTRISTVNSGSNSKPAPREGSRIVRIRYNLQHSKGGTAVTQENGCTGRQDWTNLSNSLGSPNGVAAGITSNTLSARDGILVLNYQNFTNKGSLSISDVRLLYYVRQTGTLLNNGNMQLRWRKNSGAWNTLATYTGDVDFFTGPDEYSIIGSISTWSELDTIEVGIASCLPITLVSIQNYVDAVVLAVDASVTDTF